MTTALLLSGAGARGILQAGMLKGIIESKVPIDMVFGGSAGSLNGAMYQQGDFDVIEKTWMEISNSKVYNSNPLTWANAFIGKASVYDPSPLRKLLYNLIDFDKQKANKTPFQIIATDLQARKPISMLAQDANTKDDLVSFLFASSSPPIFFPVVSLHGQTLADAGLANNFAVSNAIAAGADHLIILRPLPKYLDGAPRNIIDMVGLTVGIATENYLERELNFVAKLNEVEDPKYRKIKVTLITCPNNGIDLLEFDYKGLDRKALIQAGYTQAREALQRAFN